MESFCKRRFIVGCMDKRIHAKRQELLVGKNTTSLLLELEKIIEDV